MTGTEEVDMSTPSGEQSDGSKLSAAESRRYNLRLCSQVNRVMVERRRDEPKRKKPKCKPPPLSKYRRKTANSRERTRMTEINHAFEELRNVIPQYPPGKMTKITTLRLALNYLAELRELLGYPPADIGSSCSESGSSSEASSSGSVSDCVTSPEPSEPSLPSSSSPSSSSPSSASPSSSSASDLQEPFSDLADTDSDTSLNQLFELNLDASLQDTPLDTSLDNSLEDLTPIDLPS